MNDSLAGTRSQKAICWVPKFWLHFVLTPSIITFLLLALYGVLFESDEEAAFSNYRLWESFGFIFAYILQTQICVYQKLWVILFVLLSGMAGYLVIEFKERQKQRNNDD